MESHKQFIEVDCWLRQEYRKAKEVAKELNVLGGITNKDVHDKLLLRMDYIKDKLEEIECTHKFFQS